MQTIDFQNLTQIQNNQTLMEEVENKETKKFLSSLSEGIGFTESQPDLDLFQDDNDVQKKPTKYRNRQIKTRNSLRNVSHRRYKPEDVENLLSLFSRFQHRI